MNAVGIGWLQEESVAYIALVEEVAGEVHQVISQHGVTVTGVADAGNDAGEASGINDIGGINTELTTQPVI